MCWRACKAADGCWAGVGGVGAGDAAGGVGRGSGTLRMADWATARRGSLNFAFLLAGSALVAEDVAECCTLDAGLDFFRGSSNCDAEDDEADDADAAAALGRANAAAWAFSSRC